MNRLRSIFQFVTGHPADAVTMRNGKHISTPAPGRMRLWLPVLIGAILCTAQAACADAIPLAVEGRPAASIVTADEAPPQTREAAAELAAYLGKITGADFPVRTESTADRGQSVISVGATRLLAESFPDLDLSKLKPDAIVMKSNARDLFLAGEGPRGDLYAVSTFLEDVCGVRWWDPGAEHVPKDPNLAVRPPDKVFEPPFMSREIYYHDMVVGYGRTGPVTADEKLFARRMKNNGHHAPLGPEDGGTLKLLGWAHTTQLLLPVGKYFDSHPEWFSNNQPWSAQPCLTNDGLRAELIKNARALLDSNPGTRVISISANDSEDACACAGCRALDAQGSPTDSWLGFVNEVAAALEESHPGILVETLAYKHTEPPPIHTRARPNVIVRLAPIEASWSQPFEGGTYPFNREFLQTLAGWKNAADRLFIWDYTVNFSNLLLPHPNLRALGPNLKTYAANNVAGVFAQGNSFSRAGDFDELKAWLLARLMWDPSRDPATEIADFIKGYYGPAAGPITAYLDLLEEKKPEFLRCYANRADWLDLETMNRATALFDEAERLAAGDPGILRRVQRARLPLDHQWILGWKSYKQQADEKGLPFAGPGELVPAIDRLRQECARLGATHIAEGNGVENSTHIHLDAVRHAQLPPEAALPEPFQHLGVGDVIDIQESRMRFFNKAGPVDDPKASNGRAARMTGDNPGWNIQVHRLPAYGIEGSWRVLAAIRADVPESAGDAPAFTAGIYSGRRLGTIAKAEPAASLFANGDYHLIDLGTARFDPQAYSHFYITPGAPSSGAREIFVDRVLFVREKGAPL